MCSADPNSAGNRDRFLQTFRAALRAITEPRFFETERGYQGALLAELQQRLAEVRLPGNPILEQEYQKRISAHGLRIRPDIILHIPFGRRELLSRKDGNFVAIAIKLRGTEADAIQDFESLRKLREELGYPLTIFLNLDSDCTYSELIVRKPLREIVCFAVRLVAGDTTAPSVELRES